MAPANTDPQAQKQALIVALNERRVNTIGELRRIERIFATLGSSDVTQPMTSACTDSILSKSSERFADLLQGCTTSIHTVF